MVNESSRCSGAQLSYDGVLAVIICYQQILGALEVEQIGGKFLPRKTGYKVRV